LGGRITFNPRFSKLPFWLCQYNAAHWDGSAWEYIRINSTATLYCIQYFNEDDIWVSSGYPKHWDGNNWTHFDLSDYGLEIAPGYACWGTSSSDMYFVGFEGSIVHYNGSEFIEMDSGTDVHLRNIDGTDDGEHVFVVGRDINYPSPCVILEYSNNNWETLYYIEGSLSERGKAYSVGVIQDTVYFYMTTGLWKYNYVDNMWLNIPYEIAPFESAAFTSITIHSYNDIFWGGAGFKYGHYNGNSYIFDRSIMDMFSSRSCNNSDYNGSIAVMVGQMFGYQHAMVARGYHQ
jgi:hypothetical protein